jgi:hypothetical protein
VRNALIALLLSASTVASAVPTAVKRGVVVQGGLHFTKTIVLDQTMKTEGGGILSKGSYEVRFESVPGNKVHATFFQGGARKGEANGIIIVGGSNQAIGGTTGPGPGPGPGGKNAFSFEDIGLGPQSRAACFPPIGTLQIGVEGGSQIQIGLKYSAVQRGGIAGPADLGAQKVQPGN